MNCPNCQAPLGEGVLFCGQCGADLRNYQPNAAGEPAGNPIEQPWQQAPQLDEEMTVVEYPAYDPNAIPQAAGTDPNAYAPGP